MTTTIAAGAPESGTTAPAPADGSVTVSTATGGIRRLNPEDGLFLRAEHLNQMQSYARELALAVGIAGGTGVVYGYGLTLTGSDLTVTPGLAIDSGGLPLRTGDPVTLSLDALATPAGRFWIVEVMADADKLSGNEPVYGTLCGDPCSTGSLNPWLDDAVQIRVTPKDTLPALASVSSPNLAQNWLASAYFERERRGGPPWLTPDAAGATVAAISAQPWSAPPPAEAPATLGDASANAVPIGALLQVDGEWVLDVWTARRDLLAPVSRGAWEWRLGLRPWAVFVAQVLQFQAQLGDAPGVSALGEAVFGDAEEFYEVVVKQAPRSRRAMQQVWNEWQQKHRKPLTESSLLGHGFGELPPAGFLPMPTGQGDLQTQIEAIFGANVVVQLHYNSADAALRAVTEAQHLDRIPLDQPAHKPVVDVWIPDTTADLPAVFTPSYSWIAFARSRDEPTEAKSPTPDAVGVYVVVIKDGQRLDDVTKSVTGGSLPAGDPLVTLQYPAAEWGVPATEDDVAVVAKQVSDELDQPHAELLGVIGLAKSAARRPLAAARASLLQVGLESDGEVNLPITSIVQRDTREAILFILSVPPELN